MKTRRHSKLNPLGYSMYEYFSWLPYANFQQTFECLDDYRLGRQMFEAGAIVDDLLGVGSSRWKKHLCARMWKGYESALGLYYSLSIREMHVRKYRTLAVPVYDFYHGYTTATLHYAAKKFLPLSEIVYPPWLGDERLHSSHRAGLLKLEPKFYAQHEWTESLETPIFYPEGIEDEATDNNSKPRKIESLVAINTNVDTV